ncbi:MAG: hypothetical protein K5859_03725 [Atopobiaceae bacterium]|nr:hypothetical protein [Atopobiaceae bacterium]
MAVPVLASDRLLDGYVDEYASGGTIVRLAHLAPALRGREKPLDGRIVFELGHPLAMGFFILIHYLKQN